MKSLLRRIEHFWFAPVTSTGFGLMRMCFGLIAFTAFLWQWHDVTRYYADIGMIPHAEIGQFLRPDWRFSVLDYIGDPTGVFMVYLVLLTCLALTTIGVVTRPALLIATVLIFSFHERNPVILAGGDTVLRHVAFFLVLSPCHRSFSLWSYKQRFEAWIANGIDPVRTIARMPVWPYRLLLWQFAMIYLASIWTKLHGTMWQDGSAVEIVLHHEHFLRFPAQMMMPILPLGWLMAYYLLIAQGSWGVLLLGPVVTWFFPPAKKVLSQNFWRRFALLTNFTIHLLIFTLMEVGMFSLILFTGYVGLLTEADFAALRRLCNWRRKGTISVLYDGRCGLCRHSVFTIHVLDWLKRVTLVNYHDATARKRVAPTITFGQLDKALHIVLPNRRILKGFRALRALSWHLPVLWPIAPVLYIPGVRFIGDIAYARIARSRRDCTHESCGL